MGNLSGFVKRLRDIMRNDAGINGDAQRIEQIAWMLFLKVYDAKEKDWEWNDDGYVSIIPENCRWANWAADDRSGSAMTGDRLLDFVNNTLFPTLKKLPVTASTPIRKAIVQTTFADANNYMKDGVLLRQVVNVIDDLDLSDYEESHAFGEIYETILKELQSAGSAGEFYTPRAVTDFMAKMIEPKIGETMADFACGTGGFITSWLKELERAVKTTEDREAARPTATPSTASRRSSSPTCSASRTCSCTTWTCRRCFTRTPSCTTSWTTPKATSSTSSS